MMTAPVPEQDREGLAWLLNGVEWPDGVGDDDYSRMQADAVLASGWLARVKREAAAEALREAHDEIHALDPPEYHDAPQYREGLIDGHGVAAAVCLALADRLEGATDE